ncbi:hypothetical protein GCM10022421_33790 [Oceanisphaera sediminis]|uniref:Uncharacterized protein n=1 Tax=Oceanisphaera sediminis TaxID=981381 RepID=A0ABP7EQ59_9GAMM
MRGKGGGSKPALCLEIGAELLLPLGSGKTDMTVDYRQGEAGWGGAVQRLTASKTLCPGAVLLR